MTVAGLTLLLSVLAIRPAVAVSSTDAIDRMVECLMTPQCAGGDLNADGRTDAGDLVVAVRLGRTADPSGYARIVIGGDASPTGVFDPSIIFAGAASGAGHIRGWMAYSGVDYHVAGGNLVRDVATHVATSADAGSSWNFVQTVNEPAPVTVTVGDLALCGQSACAGRMISEVSFLLDDATDPDPTRRFKLFAHRYFLYPPRHATGQDTQPQLGSINLRTAASPDGTWSSDQPLLGWNLTPPEITPVININRLSETMASCLAVSEGGGVAVGNEIDVAFICPFVDAQGIRQRIVLLRSHDHAASFEFVRTLLEPTDGAVLSAASLSAPTLFVYADREYLIVTPVTEDQRYAGCALLAFADHHAGLLERHVDGTPIFRQILPTQGGRFGGACTWNAGATTGILMSQLVLESDPPDPFRIFSTGVGP